MIRHWLPVAVSGVVLSMGIAGCAPGAEILPVVADDGTAEPTGNQDPSPCAVATVIDPLTQEQAMENRRLAADRGAEYGAATPEQVVDLLSEGRDPFTGASQSDPAVQRSQEYQEQVSAMQGLRDDVRSGRADRREDPATSATGARVRFGSDAATVVVMEAAGRWFPVGLSWPTACPADATPTSP